MATSIEPKPEVSSSTGSSAKLNTEIFDSDSNTKLHYIAALGLTDKITKDAIDRQKIDIKNYLGWTPLMMACKNGHLEMVKLLLEFGADPSKRNRFEMSVFLVSIASGNLNIVTLILQHLLCGGISRRTLQSMFSPLSIAILYQNHDILQFLMTQKFDVNASTPNTGITPLMFATAMDDETALRILRAAKADPTLKNYSGFTAADIKSSREIKEEVPIQQLQPPQIIKPSALTPAELISNSPHMSPFMGANSSFLSPRPTFILLTPEQMNYQYYQLRKSSNTSPNYFIATPHLTPIGPTTAMVSPQYFFPPDFNVPMPISPTLLQSTFNSSNGSREFLNARINLSQLNQSGMFLSPSAYSPNGFLSPCV